MFCEYNSVGYICLESTVYDILFLETYHEYEHTEDSEKSCSKWYSSKAKMFPKVICS